MIREHEPDENGRCRHCGAWALTEQTTCNPRQPSALRPEPVERKYNYVADDADTISERLAELRRERDAVLNEPELPIAGQVLAAEDICYG